MIANCTIKENVAINGGGIHCFRFTSAMIENCLILGNKARYRGGGIDCSLSPLTIMNCTISENGADGIGGGIRWDTDDSPTIKNCILWENTSPDGPEISGHSPYRITYSDIQGGWSGIGNIDADPLLLEGWGFQLSAESPCIDAGDPALSYVDECLPPSRGTERNDIGAYGGRGACVWISCLDEDGDSYHDEACGGEDCDDDDPEVNPVAAEICDNGIDDDCDGFVDAEEHSCRFVLELEASYEGSTLSLEFTLGLLEPAIWMNFIILTNPTVQIIPLWTVPLQAIDPPIEMPISFPFPSMGWIWIWTTLLTEEGVQADVFDWVSTG